MPNSEHEMVIFNQPNASRKGEAAFLNALKKYYPSTRILKENFPVSQNFLEKFIGVEQISQWLQADVLLPARKRLACLEILEKFPSEFLQIALQPKQISFDIVVQIADKIFYWEFHEKQHAKLSVDRIATVYTSNGKSVEAPRYFQRLVRDIWRALYFRPYTIVWQDWFVSSPNKNASLELLDGFREFHIENSFSFEKFMHLNIHPS